DYYGATWDNSLSSVLF
nr:immunoglobulin light chain junction region [Macaca mulatta]